MKLYDCETAPSPRRVRIFIAEKGIELETVQVDLGNGEHFSDEFQKINPDCTVPVLELDDGTCISEITPICLYLEAKHPEPALIGETDEERATTLMWNQKVEQQGMMAMADAFRNVAKGLAGRALPGPVNYEQIPALAERGRARVGNFLNRMNERLADNEFIAGNRFTIADITAMVTVDFAARLKIVPADDAEHVKRWHAAVSSRPSASA